ncbi:CCA-adding enzyme [Candidatus Bathyarchaeota archaeon RBG_13_38_9]|nr:MAG: CCA-adding enzyme [Candidatus Bathyarchaeota archaeon RBG_13_38_9]
MKTETEKISIKVLERIVPKKSERNSVENLAQKIMNKVAEASDKSSLNAKVSLEGSVAKDTWLSGEADIDIFLQVDSKLERKDLETTCLEVARQAIRGHKPIERFAEHPYIETLIGKTRVNIVPCYLVEKGKWKSATDRTPYHTVYVKKNLDNKLKNEIRLLKKFMKGIGTYGAEIRVGGFSGMLCETLILYYKSFYETIHSATSWKKRTIIDLENHHNKDFEEILDLFEHPLIVIDPIDENRNVSAAVTEKKLWEFVSASRLFLKKPDTSFFFPLRVKRLNVSQFQNILTKRGTNIIGVHIADIGAPVDVIWSQIYKAEKSIINLLHSHGFSVLRTYSFSNEKNFNIIIIELENRILSKTMKHLGPPVEKGIESERFLLTHLQNRGTISGPWIEKNRWVTHKKREQIDAKQVLKENLSNGGRHFGIPNMMANQIVKKKFTILADNEIQRFFDIPEFSSFMNSHLKGKPSWLGNSLE